MNDNKQVDSNELDTSFWLFREGFLKRLAIAAGRELTEKQIDGLSITLGETDGFIESVEKNQKYYKGARPYEEAVSEYKIEYVLLKDVQARIDFYRGYRWWLYDRRTGVVIFGLHGGHEHLSAELYGIYKNIEDTDAEEDAELYLNEGFGCFVSGAMQMWIPYKAEDFHFTDEEQILNKIKGPHAWRSLKNVR